MGIERTVQKVSNEPFNILRFFLHSVLLLTLYLPFAPWKPEGEEDSSVQRTNFSFHLISIIIMMKVAGQKDDWTRKRRMEKWRQGGKEERKDEKRKREAKNQQLAQISSLKKENGIIIKKGKRERERETVSEIGTDSRNRALKQMQPHNVFCANQHSS